MFVTPHVNPVSSTRALCTESADPPFTVGPVNCINISATKVALLSWMVEMGFYFQKRVNRGKTGSANYSFGSIDTCRNETVSPSN